MSVFCCCRAAPPEDDSEAEEGSGQRLSQAPIPLPTLPPPARLADNCLLADCFAPVQRLDTAASLQSGGAVSSTISSMPTHGHIHPGELVLEESDAEGELDSPIAKKTGGPLDAVCLRFLRARPQGASTRAFRTSVGTSEEELARRAELRRLMHRRIQEELENEDAPLKETSALSASTRKHVAPAVPGGGPRDTLEFSMVDTLLPDEARVEKQVLVTLKTPQSPAAGGLNGDNTPAVPSHQAHLSLTQQEQEKSMLSASYTEILASINIPEVPATPLLRPTQQPPAADDTSPSSLRLSVASSRLEPVHVGRTGKSTTRQETPSVNARDYSSGLGSWLLMQGLCHGERSANSMGVRPREAKTSVNDVQILQSTKPPDSHVLDLDLPDIALFDSYTLEHQPWTSSARARGERTSTTQRWHDAESIVNQSSSVYASVASTRLPTPRTSAANSDVEIPTRSLHGLQLSPFGRLGRAGLSLPRGSDNASSHSLAVPKFNRPRLPTLEGSPSAAVSETSSYHRREAELEAVEKRFADVVAIHQSKEPKRSRFKEEFDLPMNPGLVTRSSMLLQKLHLPVPNFSRPRSRSSGQPAALAYHQFGSPASGSIQGSDRLPNRQSMNDPCASHTLPPI